MRKSCNIAILNQLCNCCRGNPPVAVGACEASHARVTEVSNRPAYAGVGTGALPLQILTNHIGLLYLKCCS
jgi:hypothetical protein